MPRVEASVVIPLPGDVAFAVSQTQGEVRYRWDNFVRSQTLMHGAQQPAPGVQTRTRSKHGFSMISEYISFRPPKQVGMKMVQGPWFFEKFAAGWSFRQLEDDRTEATWRYTFSIRPSWLRPAADPIGIRLLQRDIERRIAGYARGCADPVVLAAATASPIDQANNDD